MREPKLKTCPFCGGEVCVENYTINEPVTMFEFGYQIVCKKCNCGSRQMTPKLPELLTEAEKEIYKKAVIERWNRRANDEQADC